MENQQELLPGFPDEFTLKEIAPKLPWSDISVLARVSRGWRNAIRNRHVYQERVRSGLTETIILVNSFRDLVVCYMKDKSTFKLPRCPPYSLRKASKRLVVDLKCVVVDLRVYVFDGARFGVLHMLDLAGLRVWTRCANMQLQREDFGYGAMDGKIYVFGGRTNATSRGCEVEVFDPKENTWSQRTPMPLSKYGCKVLTFEETFGLYAGRETREPLVPLVPLNFQVCGDLLQIYHPLKDEWSSVYVRVPRYLSEPIFVARGKLHTMSDRIEINAQELDGSSCRGLCSDSIVDVRAGSRLQFCPSCWLVFGDEILVTGHVFRGSEVITGMRLLRSEGFGIKEKELVWREERDWPFKESVQLIHACQF